MKYYEDMRSKWGFGDGDSVPADAEASREVYIKAINALAEAMNSQWRAYAFDRPGVHNWCLLLFAPKDEDAEAYMGEENVDVAMAEAVDIAHELELDQYIEVDVRVHEDALERNIATNATRVREDDDMIVQVGEVIARECYGCRRRWLLNNVDEMPEGWEQVQGHDYCDQCLAKPIQLELF